uniref:Uncharacterized protein n=1 Tax=Alexandrium monilatum TaxID=311494 RepID=A0A7S4W6G4_9DINO
MMRKEARPQKSALQAALESVLDGNDGQRMLAVEASVRPTYEAFPKNALGRIPPSEIFPAIVRGYFAKEHGWQLRGLEPPSLAPRPSEVHEALVLLSSAPSLAKALKEGHDANQGLSLSDVVGTITAIEHLILDESAALLRGAYVLNQLPEDSPLDEGNLTEVLHSYLLLFRHGHPHNLTDVRGHQAMKARAQRGNFWGPLVKFAHEAVEGSSRAAPYSFTAVSAMVRGVALAYGRWQNSECGQMKTTLMDLSINGSGLVPLERFHSEPKHAVFQFTESVEYLRKTGALEEPASGQPLVRVPNYLLGPSNCIASSEHYSVCCLSECEAVASELERSVQAPVAPVGELLELVAATPSSSLAAPRELPVALGEDLRTVASHHGGSVPLHSADFQRWLHAAFPNECPAPTAADSAAEETERMAAEEWLAVQQECTRIPDWHPSNQDEAIPKDPDQVVNV